MRGGSAMKKVKKLIGCFVALALFMATFMVNQVDVYAANGEMRYVNGQWRYYENGRLVPNYTGMAWNEYGWWYFENGNLNPDYTGMACNENGWFYYQNGHVDFNYTGMACNEYGWWYFYNGGIVYDYTGPACNEYGWWAFRNGQIDFTFNGMLLNEYGWWYFENGGINLQYTGMACNEYGWWYFENGYLNPNYTGMACNENGWFYYQDGRINFNYTGMACNEYGWWYFRDGYLDMSWTGIAQNEYGYWYFRNGNIAFDYSGTVNYQGSTYNVTNGHAEKASDAKDVDSNVLNPDASDYAQKYDLSAFDTSMLSQTRVYKRLQKLNLSLSDMTNASENKAVANNVIENALSGLPTERVEFDGTTVGDLAAGGLNDFLLENQGKVVVLKNDIYIRGGNNTGDTIMIPSNTILDGDGHSLISDGTAPNIGIVFYYITDYKNFNSSSNAGVRNLNSSVPYNTNCVNLFGASKIAIENCTFTNCKGNAIAAETSHEEWNSGANPEYVLISGNTISNCGGDGIAICGNPAYVKVTGNRISDLAGRAGIMVKCYLGDNPVAVEDQTVGPHDIIVESNDIHDINKGSNNDGEGLYCIGTYKTYMVNNKIYNCKLEGCCLDSGCIGTWFYGNEIYNTGTLGGLPGLSIDNGLYNFVDNNNIHDNTCDGVKLVRTGDANLIVNNVLRDNSTNLVDSRVSSGVDIEPLAVEAGDRGKLDGFGSDGNIVMLNTISGHSCGVYIAEDSIDGETQYRSTSIENVVKFNTISATGHEYDGSILYLVDYSNGKFNRMKKEENTLN